MLKRLLIASSALAMASSAYAFSHGAPNLGLPTIARLFPQTWPQDPGVIIKYIWWSFQTTGGTKASLTGASIAGNTLTVGTIVSGTPANTMIVTGPGVLRGTYVKGACTGSPPVTCPVNQAQNVGPIAMTLYSESGNDAALAAWIGMNTIKAMTGVTSTGFWPEYVNNVNTNCTPLTCQYATQCVNAGFSATAKYCDAGQMAALKANNMYLIAGAQFSAMIDSDVNNFISYDSPLTVVTGVGGGCSVKPTIAFGILPTGGAGGSVYAWPSHVDNKPFKNLPNDVTGGVPLTNGSGCSGTPTFPVPYTLGAINPSTASVAATMSGGALSTISVTHGSGYLPDANGYMNQYMVKGAVDVANTVGDSAALIGWVSQDEPDCALASGKSVVDIQKIKATINNLDVAPRAVINNWTQWTFNPHLKYTAGASNPVTNSLYYPAGTNVPNAICLTAPASAPPFAAMTGAYVDSLAGSDTVGFDKYVFISPPFSILSTWPPYMAAGDAAVYPPDQLMQMALGMRNYSTYGLKTPTKPMSMFLETGTNALLAAPYMIPGATWTANSNTPTVTIPLPTYPWPGFGPVSTLGNCVQPDIHCSAYLGMKLGPFALASGSANGVVTAVLSNLTAVVTLDGGAVTGPADPGSGTLTVSGGTQPNPNCNGVPPGGVSAPTDNGGICLPRGGNWRAPNASVAKEVFASWVGGSTSDGYFAQDSQGQDEFAIGNTGNQPATAFNPSAQDASALMQANLYYLNTVADTWGRVRNSPEVDWCIAETQWPTGVNGVVVNGQTVNTGNNEVTEKTKNSFANSDCPGTNGLFDVYQSASYGSPANTLAMPPFASVHDYNDVDYVFLMPMRCSHPGCAGPAQVINNIHYAAWDNTAGEQVTVTIPRDAGKTCTVVYDSNEKYDPAHNIEGPCAYGNLSGGGVFTQDLGRNGDDYQFLIIRLQ